MRRQSKSQIIGRAGERWFESVLPPEWSIQRPIDDFGLDGIVAVGNSTHLTPYEFGVQVKSSSRFNVVSDHIVVPKISRDEVLYWSKKFFPTLLVAYDTNRKIGYFEWISNLVDLNDIQSGRSSFYLHIHRERLIGNDCWNIIKNELECFHAEFSLALRGAREIIPAAANLAILLRNLCMSNMADVEKRDGQILYLTAQAWTHAEVIRLLDRIIPQVTPQSIASQNLQRFRNSYWDTCKLIFHNLEEHYGGEAQWIMMKKLPEAGPILNELTAMLSDCVSGLLSYAAQSNDSGIGADKR